MLKQLDVNILKEWENEQHSSQFPTLSDFLENKTKTFETISRLTPQNGNYAENSTSNNSNQSRTQHNKVTNAASSKVFSCVCCHRNGQMQ